jgi:hypothetical protein
LIPLPPETELLLEPHAASPNASTPASAAEVSILVGPIKVSPLFVLGTLV